MRGLTGTTLAAFVVLLAVSPIATASSLPWPFSAEGIANRSAAREDASALLATLPLPPGASPSTEQPPGTPPILKSIGRRSPTVALRTSWWTAPGEPKALTEWMLKHPPAGIGSLGGGMAATFGSGETASVAHFAWPQVPKVLTSRALYAAAAPGPAGTSIIRADALVTWFAPRPPQERVPSSARFLEIASLINGFEVVQPKGGPCPKRAPRHRIWLTFRLKEGGPALAKASEGLPAIGCQALRLSVGGKTLLPLDKGQVLYGAVKPMLEETAKTR
jgi:hypothetical protein